jgi:altronate dehydratase
MRQTFDFDEIGRLPEVGDNVAIATQALEPGTIVRHNGARLELDNHVMEGHRFAIAPIAEGDYLLSWQLPFGRALRRIEAGGYVCNREILDALRVRRLEVSLPTEPNFEDWHSEYTVDPASFHPGHQVSQAAAVGTFWGFARPANRGVGTRNYIVVLGTSSRTSGFAQLLAQRTHHLVARCNQIDGIVPIAHTEGGEEARPNNLQLVLRTMAGLMVHPNVGAVLAVDSGSEAINNRLLKDFMERENYPLAQVRHRFMSLDRPFDEALAAGEECLGSWIEPVEAMHRSEQSLSKVALALQCGGSDAFSGISGNPLAAWIAREVIRWGGRANLAETDELIGAEPYVLQNVRDLETAERFLTMIRRFKTWSAWHGNSADSNPSGGNKLRGIYNIVLKSIGAARKRHPSVRLDYAIDYAEPMQRPGYYFMDSPGNDLESIAGQVAAGCNLIFFVTGNGSITNFPIVPTIKIVTTTRRHSMLSKEMDVNAGAFLDGTPMDELGRQTLDLSVAVASGQPTFGETAGHAQVQLWRNWQQNDGTHLNELQNAELPTGQPIPIRADKPAPAVKTQELGAEVSLDRIGLILPTSLCSSQIARMTAETLNAKGIGREQGILRFVALVHTEGCGVSAGYAEDLQLRTLVGYLTHPLVRRAFLIEHGCEKTHNDYLRIELEKRGRDPRDFGWASIQLDGGIEAVTRKVEDWFTTELIADPNKEVGEAGQSVCVGLLGSGEISPESATALRHVATRIVSEGGTVIVPQNAPFAYAEPFSALYLERQPAPSLAYGAQPQQPGFHLMESPTGHWVETLTGLGAAGAGVMMAYMADRSEQGHPLVPVLRVSSEIEATSRFEADLDLVLRGDTDSWGDSLLGLLADTVSLRYQPRALAQGNTDFQLTRGLLGTSA